MFRLQPSLACLSPSVSLFFAIFPSRWRGPPGTGSALGFFQLGSFSSLSLCTRAAQLGCVGFLWSKTLWNAFGCDLSLFIYKYIKVNWFDWTRSKQRNEGTCQFTETLVIVGEHWWGELWDLQRNSACFHHERKWPAINFPGHNYCRIPHRSLAQLWRVELDTSIHVLLPPLAVEKPHLFPFHLTKRFRFQEKKLLVLLAEKRL